MAHEAAQVGAAAPSQFFRQCSLGCCTRQFDLDQFVIGKRLIEGRDHPLADPRTTVRTTDINDRFLAVGELAQMSPLGSREGCGGEGHGRATVARASAGGVGFRVFARPTNFGSWTNSRFKSGRLNAACRPADNPAR